MKATWRGPNVEPLQTATLDAATVERTMAAYRAAINEAMVRFSREHREMWADALESMTYYHSVEGRIHATNAIIDAHSPDDTVWTVGVLHDGYERYECTLDLETGLIEVTGP